MNTVKAQPARKQELKNIIDESTRGVIFLEGPSAVGKSYLLKQLRENSGRDVKILSYETVVQHIVSGLADRTYSASEYVRTLKADIVCIEDVDFLRGKETIQTEFSRLARFLSTDCLVIFTGIRLYQRVPHIFSYVDNDRYFSLCRP